MNQVSAKRSRGRDLAIVGAALLVVLAICAGSLLWGAAGAAFGRDAAISTAQVLGGGQARADRLPPGFPADQHGDGGIDAGSSRLLGVQNGTSYWIALDARSNVCVLAQPTGRSDVIAAACSDAGELETSGTSLRVDAGTWRLEAFLVPDSIDATSLSGGWTAVADNLVTYSGPGSSGSVQLERDPGSPGAPVTLTREPAPVG
jgi:hypothetical protein